MANVWDDFRSEGLPDELVVEIRESYEEMKENYYAGNLRPQEVEGGRFAEAGIRICQFETGGVNGNPYTPLSEDLPAFIGEVDRLRKLPDTYHDSFRLRIPRVLHSIYDIRNGRDVAHLASDVNPNLADSSLVVANADWVLAEIVRLFNDVDLDEAQARVDGLVKRQVPAVEMFGEVPQVLRPGLNVPGRTLIVLYHFDERGATARELADWLKIEPYHARNTLQRQDERDEVYFDEDADCGYITRLGIKKVEEEIGLSGDW